MHGCLALYSVDGQRETNIRSVCVAILCHSHVISVSSCFFFVDKAERTPVFVTHT